MNDFYRTEFGGTTTITTMSLFANSQIYLCAEHVRTRQKKVRSGQCCQNILFLCFVFVNVHIVYDRSR